MVAASVAALALTPAGGAAVSGHWSPRLPPREALLQARTQIARLVGAAGASQDKRAEMRALRALARATTSGLWLNPREIVAPPYGERVFGLTRLAEVDLRGVPGLTATDGAIVAADRALAAGVLGEARSGNRADLDAARSDLRRGDRKAVEGHSAAAVQSYAAAWKTAFNALTSFVVSRTTAIPAPALAAAAENALGSRRIGLAGPLIEQGQPPLTAAGKPEVFFAGSEACPFCGVQRWGMIVALAQFGTFSGLSLLASTALEPPPVQGFTFFGASYQSPYVAFVPVEIFSNVPGRIGFRHLSHPAPSETALIQHYDESAQVPFIDVDNRFVTVQSTVQPQLLAGRSWSQIVRSLRNPASVPAQAVGGEAEVLTAEICEATNGAPASICSQPVVHDYEAALPLLNGRGGGCAAAALDRQLARRGQRPVATATHCHRG